MTKVIVTDIQQTVHHMISVEEMIESLKKLPAGSMLCLTQEGHYAQSSFGDISLPCPILLSEEKNEREMTVFAIGHSDQRY